jgi:transcriptional regulator with XRE-family HTH domain
MARLSRGSSARAEFVSSHVDKTLAFQLRAIRDRQGLSQEKLAEMVDMNQNAISRLESEWYGKPTIRTLKRLAAALDVALVVRFVPFNQLVDWVSGTPFMDRGLSTSALAVPSFEEEKTQMAVPKFYLDFSHLIRQSAIAVYSPFEGSSTPNTTPQLEAMTVAVVAGRQRSTGSEYLV